MSIFEKIREIDEEDINDVMEAVFERKRQLYPDWEILYAAIPKNDPEQRRQMIHYMLEVLEKAL